MPELDDERYVRELFEQLYGAQLRKVPESREKTFDFELLSHERRIAAVEVKRFGEVPMTPENGWTPTHGGFMSRTDNAAARVGKAIHAAYKQLSTTTDRKVLVVVNDASMDALDLDEAVNGYLVYGDGDQRFRNPTGRKIAEGPIREEKFAIDLYIWINRYDGRFPRRVDGLPLEPHAERGPHFKCTSQVGHDLATTYFKLPSTPKPDRNPDADVPTLGELLRRQAMGR